MSFYNYFSKSTPKMAQNKYGEISEPLMQSEEPYIVKDSMKKHVLEQCASYHTLSYQFSGITHPARVYEALGKEFEVPANILQQLLNPVQLSSAYRMGKLAVLSDEMLLLIANFLSLQDVFNMRQVNKQCRAFFGAVPYYEQVLTSSIHIYWLYLRTGLGQYFTLQDLYIVGHEFACHICGQFAENIWLPTCTRLCTSCFEKNPIETRLIDTRNEALYDKLGGEDIEAFRDKLSTFCDPIRGCNQYTTKKFALEVSKIKDPLPPFEWDWLQRQQHQLPETCFAVQMAVRHPKTNELVTPVLCKGCSDIWTHAFLCLKHAHRLSQSFRSSNEQWDARIKCLHPSHLYMDHFQKCEAAQSESEQWLHHTMRAEGTWNPNDFADFKHARSIFTLNRINEEFAVAHVWSGLANVQFSRDLEDFRSAWAKPIKLRTDSNGRQKIVHKMHPNTFVNMEDVIPSFVYEDDTATPDIGNNSEKLWIKKWRVKGQKE
jgi:hypothetical protein